MDSTAVSRPSAGGGKATSLVTAKITKFSWDPNDRVIWRGKKIPQDRTIVRPLLLELNRWLYAAMVILSILGVVFAILLVYFNFKYAHRR